MLSTVRVTMLTDRFRLGDLVNDWRKSLDLEIVPWSEGAGLTENLDVPFTYCWSPALVPKPEDWAAHIGKSIAAAEPAKRPITDTDIEELDVCGFFFRQAPDYTPDERLGAWLASGPAPIYIGFGSIVIDDPVALTNTLKAAIDITGVRAIISKGWSKLGGDIEEDNDSNIFYLGDCPHEWLFQQVSVVIHHGGAGTTACGILNGKPTLIVPFFGE